MASEGLSKDEMDALVEKYIMKNDQIALEKIVNACKGLVHFFARRYCYGNPTHPNYDDLVQEGWIGFMLGIRKYKSTYKAKFSSYIQYWIRAGMYKYMFKTHKTMHIPTTDRGLFFSILRGRSELENLGKYSIKELAKKFKKSEKYIEEFLTFMDANDSPLDSFDCEYMPEQNFDTAYRKIMVTQFRTFLDSFIKTLKDPRDLEIMERRMLSNNPETLNKLANRFGISRERVRQKEACMFRKLNKAYTVFNRRGL